MYATQKSSAINIKLVYQREAESQNFTYIWWTTIKSITTKMNYQTQITDQDKKIFIDDHVDSVSC